MKKLAGIWSSFPAEHRKRFYQGLCIYLLLCAGAVTWVALHGKTTVHDWESRIPSVSAPVSVSAASTPSEETASVTENAPAASSAAPVDSKAYVALVVTGLGLSSSVTEKALSELPPEVAFAFSPYAENIQNWITKSTQGKHEALIMLPMESITSVQDDPGPKALSSRQSDQENEENVAWLLKQGNGTVGAINFMGSRFLADKRKLLPAFDALLKNHSMFIETPGIEKSAGSVLAEQIGLPYLAANIQIDSNATETDIHQQLNALEKAAHEQGYAIGIAEPYPLTLSILKTWISEAKTRGITLAPLNTVWKNKPRHDTTTAAPSSEQLKQP